MPRVCGLPGPEVPLTGPWVQAELWAPSGFTVAPSRQQQGALPLPASPVSHYPKEPLAQAQAQTPLPSSPGPLELAHPA